MSVQHDEPQVEADGCSGLVMEIVMEALPVWRLPVEPSDKLIPLRISIERGIHVQGPLPVDREVLRNTRDQVPLFVSEHTPRHQSATRILTCVAAVLEY